MATLSIVPSALRRSLAPQQTCQLCVKRQGSRTARSRRRATLEVELTQVVNGLGSPGQRVLVAPGRMRNHLYPSKLALYVLHGRTLQLDGTLRERPQPREVLPEVPAAPRPASSASQILEHLEKLEPLHFERRMLGQTANAGRLHGSVIVNNILHELQKRGVPITTLDGDWQSTSVEGAIEQGRVKRPGQYIFNAKIGAAVHPIVVNVEGKDHRHPEVEAAQTTI